MLLFGTGLLSKPKNIFYEMFILCPLAFNIIKAKWKKKTKLRNKKKRIRKKNKMNKVILGWDDNEENELQKKRDNWVYIKNYNNDGQQVWVGLFRVIRYSIL